MLLLLLLLLCYRLKFIFQNGLDFDNFIEVNFILCSNISVNFGENATTEPVDRQSNSSVWTRTLVPEESMVKGFLACV